MMIFYLLHELKLWYFQSSNLGLGLEPKPEQSWEWHPVEGTRWEAACDVNFAGSKNVDLEK